MSAPTVAAADAWSLRHGQPEPPPERLALRAGPLSLTFEDGDLRWLRLDGVEVVRRVYAAVRDRDWNTYPVLIRRCDREVGARSFRIAYEAEHAGIDAAGARIAFAAKVEIRGAEDGGISFVWEGECLEDCLGNRVGICLLHPASCAGAAYAVEHVDGTREETVFPELISPHQPAFAIRALVTRPLPGVEVEVRLEGQTFEMEDQRNWGDGSFKTYAGPLRLPHTSPIRRGERFRHAMTLRLRGQAPELRPIEPARVVITGDRLAPLPRIGLRGDGGEPAAVVARLRASVPAHLGIGLDLRESSWRARLSGGIALARAVGCPLELGVIAAGGAAFAELATAAAGAPVASWLIFGGSPGATTPPSLVAAARAALGAVAPSARFGGGVRSNFTELNRDRPEGARWDAFAFASQPQQHAADSSSMVENLDGLAATVRSAAAIAGEGGVAVTPLTLALAGAGDHRQGTLFAAAWTVGALARLAGARSATCFAATGPDGILDDDGSPRPLWQVLADVREFSGADILRVEPGDPLTLAALALRQGAKTRLLIANLAPAAIEAEVSGVREPARMRVLDDRSAPRARREPDAWRADAWSAAPISGGVLRVPLTPYAIATIDA